MLVSIRKWNKVEAGIYESDQKIFDYEDAKYFGKYKIVKSDVERDWMVFKYEHKSVSSKEIIRKMIGRFDTLKEAKEFGEYDFGYQNMITDFDRAMQKA